MLTKVQPTLTTTFRHTRLALNYRLYPGWEYTQLPISISDYPIRVQPSCPPTRQHSPTSTFYRHSELWVVIVSGTSQENLSCYTQYSVTCKLSKIKGRLKYQLLQVLTFRSTSNRKYLLSVSFSVLNIKVGREQGVLTS